MIVLIVQSNITQVIHTNMTDTVCILLFVYSWDNWYRNYDRGSTGAYTVNVDTETIDYFISKAKELTYVDNRRVHMGGWSNGAAMALQYAAMTPNIASAAVYSAPDNTADANDPCAQHMNPRYNTPTLDIHNYCDIIGICTTGLYYWQDLTCRYPDSAHNIIVIDDATQNIIGENNYASCDVTCQPGSNGGWTEGATAHMRYGASQQIHQITNQYQYQYQYYIY